jgi:CIC family chloride channel protein
VLGGIVVVYLVKNFAPMAKGHGVPEVMHAIYHEQGNIPAKVSIVKALASAITIGTGGSLGREGPIVQISASFSSFLGKILKLSVSQRNLLIACGAGAGIAATFNAPLGGILFAIELLLVTVNSRTILPVAIATVISANVGQYLIGNDPAFMIPEILKMSGSSSIYVSLLAIPLGALVGLLAMVFIKSIYFSEDFFEKYLVNPYIRHIVGMLILGLLFYVVLIKFNHYYVQGVGYASIQDILYGMANSTGFLIFLLFAKLLATNLTIGSGGSGGVFSPSLFLGAVLGAIFGNLINALFPELELNSLVFVIAGMAAMVSGTTSAPLTAIVMVYEMTQDYAAILPVMTAVAVAYAVRRRLMDGDIYTLKLQRRGEFIPEGLISDLKANLRLRDYASKNIQYSHIDDSINGDHDYTCVVDSDDNILGVVDIKSHIFDEKLPIRRLKIRKFIVLSRNATALEAVIKLHKEQVDIIIISSDKTAHKDSIIGIISSNHLVSLIGNITDTLR